MCRRKLIFKILLLLCVFRGKYNNLKNVKTGVQRPNLLKAYTYPFLYYNLQRVASAHLALHTYNDQISTKIMEIISSNFSLFTIYWAK